MLAPEVARERVEGETILKLVVTGEAGAGKSSFVRRVQGYGFNLRHEATIGVDFVFRRLELEGRTFK
jgi:GTPase SAR1 family protein